MTSSLPHFIKQYFWGDNLTQLNWQDHQKYITQTILEKGGREAVSWLFNVTEKTKLKQQLASLTLSPKAANFWKIYLS